MWGKNHSKSLELKRLSSHVYMWGCCRASTRGVYRSWIVSTQVYIIIVNWTVCKPLIVTLEEKNEMRLQLASATMKFCGVYPILWLCDYENRFAKLSTLKISFCALCDRLSFASSQYRNAYFDLNCRFTSIMFMHIILLDCAYLLVVHIICWAVLNVRR